MYNVLVFTNIYKNANADLILTDAYLGCNL